MQEAKKKFIDIRKIFHDKNPRLAAMLPAFVMHYIRKTIHEDEVNEFLDVHGDKQGLEFIRTSLERFRVNVISSGANNIPASGGFIIAANHPLGGLDAFALMQEIAKRRADFKFIVNDILLQLENLKGLFIGVNKHGKNAQLNLAAIDALYSSEKGVLIFPAGLVSRKKNGIIRDLAWQKSFVTKAKKHQRNVIPVHIEGNLTNRFYSIANFRTALGIKANIEMFYLVDELFRQKNKTIEIIIGEPVPFTFFDKSKSDFEWAQWVKEKVYELAEKQPAHVSA